MNKKNIGLILVLILVAIMLGTYITEQIEKSKQIKAESIGREVELVGAEKGKLAPDFTLQTLEGDTVSLSDYKGKKIVLNFWASWCPPCKAEMPHMQDYYKKYADKENVVILAANLTYEDGSKDKVQQFIDSFNITFPILMMGNKEVVNTYKVISLPSTFMIDTDGRIQHQIVGPLDQASLKEYVHSLK
ncbi:redoxin domain-containing protein [Solibacillus sp. CAU 1738]|uniref:peroxiredoxin family protein n=1 Tax=Solibacillus sp. CAU 1738 TaxID=3140363 RepID=UPI0032611130